MCEAKLVEHAIEEFAKTLKGAVESRRPIKIALTETDISNAAVEKLKNHGALSQYSGIIDTIARKSTS